MLSPEEISKEIETIRQADPYYFTSRTFTMGTILTEGSHLYLNRSNSQWKKAMMLILDQVWADQESLGATNVYLRDFQVMDKDLNHFLINQGFNKTNVPESHKMEIRWNTPAEYIQSLPKKKRQELKKEVLLKDELEIRIAKKASPDKIKTWHSMYGEVRERNLSLNGFTLPEKLFVNIAKSSNWECMELYRNDRSGSLLAIILSYKSTHYAPIIVGLNYATDKSFNLYKNVLFQIIKRAIACGSQQIHFGVTTSLPKRKMGAQAIENTAYVQMKDNFNLSLLSLMEVRTK
jgi:predicted N-acyltransferase